jgi:hypothetical protein
MSFVHYTLVGHFDPSTLFPDRPLTPIRPLSNALIESTLDELSPDLHTLVSRCDGYVTVEWSSAGRRSTELSRFTRLLAERAECVTAESPLYIITWPEWAKTEQVNAAARLKRSEGTGRTHD